MPWPRLKKLHFLEFALDGIISRRSSLVRLLWTAAVVGTSSGTSTTLTIDRLCDLVESLHESLARLFDASHVIGCEGSTHIGYLGLQLALLLWGDLITQFSNVLFRLVSGTIRLVSLFNLFLAALIFGCMRLGITHHAVNLVFRETA